ncbi:unnamed protein product [Allacma fusca]|uniref:Chitin-binding type-2 domain-containing protein n=1 Tax=Allacma fusca TaxID=39272 RepID=A0A8J2KRY6_9HEXA|nr:unnamed protein product [Allacma fusca]
MGAKLFISLGVFLIAISGFILCPEVVEGEILNTDYNILFKKECKLYPLQCPEPLVFNTELLVCDWKWNVTTCTTEPETDYGLG